MATVTVEKEVNAPLSRVWQSWNDFGNIYKFNPNLKHSKLLKNSPETGLGARRQCDIKDGKNWIREKVIDYVPEQKLVIDIYEGTMPLKTAIATFHFKPMASERTHMEMTMDFVPKMGLLGKLMIPMMKPKFKQMLGLLLEGNAQYVTTGKLANAA